MTGFSPKRVAVAAVLLALANLGHAAPLTAFAEDFEGNLNAWTGIGGGAITQAAIVIDPLNSGNHALGFPAQGSGGSIYTSAFVSTAGLFTVSFDYLGLPGTGGVPGDLGGFFGISQGFPGSHQWIAGTLDNYTSPFINLYDTGAWQHYSLTFASQIGQSVHLMFEDFSGSGGVAGDVFFDNIQFNDSSVAPAPLPNANAVPEPGGLALVALASLLAGIATRRKQRDTRP